MGQSLFGEVRSVLAEPWSVACFERLCGWVDESGHSAELIAYIEGHMRRWPAVRERVVPRAWVARMIAGEACPGARICDALVYGSLGLEDRAAAVLCASPSLLNIRYVSLMANRLTDACLEALCEESAWESLHGLELGYNQLGGGVAVLARASWAGELRELGLGGCHGVGDFFAEAYARSDVFVRLERLDLSATGLSVSGLEELTRARRVKSLRVLGLGYNPLGDEGAAIIARRARLGDLQELDLWGAGVGESGRSALERAPHLQGLRRLRVN